MRHLLRQEVTIYTSDNRTIDGYGRPTWTGGVLHRARVNLKTIHMKNEQGEEITCDGEVFTFNDNGSLDNLEIGDRLDYATKKYRIEKISEAVNDLGKQTHVVLTIQRWQI